jgi:hypothetical protein
VSPAPRRLPLETLAIEAAILYDERNLVLARSTDAGVTWTPAEFLNRPDALRPGEQSLPRVAADAAGQWVALWKTNGALFGSDSILHYAVSGADTDGDGILDGAEPGYGTNPGVADSDADGVPDGLEVWTYGSDPGNPDTDGDGFDDGVEAAAGTDPVDPLSVPGVGPPTIVQGVELMADPATALLLTFADQYGPGSDTQPFAIDFGTVDAIVKTRIDATHGPVVSEIDFGPGGLWFDEYTQWQYEATAPIPPFTTFTVTLGARHWIGSPSTGTVDASEIATNTASLDLSATDFVFSQGEVEYASVLGYGITGWGSSDPLVIATDPTGTATLAVDPGGYNYDLTVTIPVNGSAAVPGLGADAILTGDLVLTGKYRIPQLPIAPAVGLGVALGILVTGALSARRTLRARSRNQ